MDDKEIILLPAPHIKAGYEWLDEMRFVRNEQSSYKPTQSPLTNRATFIIRALNEIGVQYELDIFDEAGYDLYDYSRPKSLNIIVKFCSRSGQPAIAFMAHFDVANINSENCQDNSASVCNLLHLCAKLKNQAIGESKNIISQRPVIIVFSDREEAGGTGARYFSGRMLRGDFGNIEYVVNLELTGLGRAVWVDTENTKKWAKDKIVETPLLLKCGEILGESGYHKVSTPFSDAFVLRRCGVDAVCIGILPVEEVLEIEKHKGGRQETWSLCHSETDTIDKCDAQDMQDFTDLLERFVTGIPTADALEGKTIPH